MRFEPEPLQRLLLWRLAVAEDGGEFLKAIESKSFAPAKRRPLVREGLVEERKEKPGDRGRASTYLELTDKGWAWCQNHLADKLTTRSPFGTAVLQRLLAHLKNYFESQSATVSIGQLIQQARVKQLSTKATEESSPGRSMQEAIRQACLDLGRDRENVRVRLADLRSHLRDVARSALDEKLLEMERAGLLSLYRLDNPQEIRAEDRAAALQTPAGSDRHIVYFGGSAS